MLKLAPEPTFVSTIRIHVPGGEDVPVNFVFRHKGKEALADYIDRGTDMNNLQAASEIVAGWKGVDSEFSEAALASLLDAYPSSGAAIVRGYVEEVTKAAEKN